MIVQTQFLFIFICIKSCGGHSLIRTKVTTDMAHDMLAAGAQNGQKEANGSIAQCLNKVQWMMWSLIN